ncbi:hypothetical protein GIB67_032941 [Kingdonia uniflora]|uniref:Uncharacterized protein n=1 Tax=Kingdonia uniflora TaxID=39325 RepID=A0A7J7MYD6_9MAGN|nr:hypothetical protein GIB67_032941 [Kingdonia uniflora]
MDIRVNGSNLMKWAGHSRVVTGVQFNLNDSNLVVSCGDDVAFGTSVVWGPTWHAQTVCFYSLCITHETWPQPISPRMGSMLLTTSRGVVRTWDPISHLDREGKEMSPIGNAGHPIPHTAVWDPKDPLCYRFTFSM